MSPFLLYILLLLLLFLVYKKSRMLSAGRSINVAAAPTAAAAEVTGCAGTIKPQQQPHTHAQIQPQFSNDTRALVVVVQIPKMLRYQWAH